MIKTLTAHGNSAALIIDKPILDLLKISLDTPLEIETDGKTLTIRPVREAREDPEFKAAMERIMGRHAKTLRRLAK